MIIECPACSTRYDIKVQLPPEGRTVRCAKCEAVWRATPEEPEPAPIEPELEAGAGPQEAASASPSDGESFPDALYIHKTHVENTAPDTPFEGLASAEAETAKDDRTGGKVRWFGTFIRRNKPAPHPESPQLASGETIPFPRLAPPFAPDNPPAFAPDNQPPAEDEFRTLDDARAAVRNVFATLGEQRPHPSASIIQAPVTAHAERGEDNLFSHTGLGSDFTAETEEPAPSEWENEPAAGQAFMHSNGTNGAGSTEDLPEAFASQPEAASVTAQSWLQEWQPETSAVNTENEIDSQLREALHAHFPRRGAGLPELPEAQLHEAPAADGGEGPVAEDLSSFWRRSPGLGGDAVIQDDEGEAAASDVSFDERLYREIEETREHARQPRGSGRKGALAVAAAWGLFLCVAGGLTAGLFVFRDIAADALPGLVPFYRVLGMPVTIQPLTFEDVQHEWAASEYKPVLRIKGAVYNRAQRSVPVPDFVISVKDDDPALDREIPASLPVEGTKIGPGERTEFELELVAPSRSINAVELELRNVH